jgi:hypothetical protein
MPLTEENVPLAHFSSQVPIPDANFNWNKLMTFAYQCQFHT